MNKLSWSDFQIGDIFHYVLKGGQGDFHNHYDIIIEPPSEDQVLVLKLKSQKTAQMFRRGMFSYVKNFSLVIIRDGEKFPVAWSKLDQAWMNYHNDKAALEREQLEQIADRINLIARDDGIPDEQLLAEWDLIRSTWANLPNGMNYWRHYYGDRLRQLIPGWHYKG